jgi:hypothetical protein
MRAGHVVTDRRVARERAHAVIVGVSHWPQLPLMVIHSVSGAVAWRATVRHGLSPQVYGHAGQGEPPSREPGDIERAVAESSSLVTPP